MTPRAPRWQFSFWKSSDEKNPSPAGGASLSLARGLRGLQQHVLYVDPTPMLF